jgi:chromosome segregation ATPase
MSDYSSSAALGYIQGAIIGQGISEVMKAKRAADQRLRERAAEQREQVDLEVALWNMRDRAINAEIAYRNENSRLALANAKIAEMNVEIAKRQAEIHRRGVALADAEIKNLELEQKLKRARDAHHEALKMVDNLRYAFHHYRRLLKIPQKGGDAYDDAPFPEWSPILVPPEQRTDPPDENGLTEYDRAFQRFFGTLPPK